MMMLACATPVLAQHDHDMSSMTPSWTAVVEAQVFLDLNLQRRKFRDFHARRANWFMITRGECGAAGLMAHPMFSPWFLPTCEDQRAGLQTETYQRLCADDYQYPHDFVMRDARA